MLCVLECLCYNGPYNVQPVIMGMFVCDNMILGINVPRLNIIVK